MGYSVVYLNIFSLHIKFGPRNMQVSLNSYLSSPKVVFLFSPLYLRVSTLSSSLYGLAGKGSLEQDGYLHQIKSNQIKSNQIKSNQIKSNQIKSNHYQIIIKSNQIMNFREQLEAPLKGLYAKFQVIFHLEKLHVRYTTIP